MGKKAFSEEQLSAINTRDRTLLVSAAAGSGKTTTLTERIIRSLLDESNPESIANMLIVTFTNAAVADMREKISEALRGAIKENPENKRLERELFLLPSARICTIDSFCNEILKQNAEKVGVNSGYRIAERAEAILLSGSIFDALINSIYEGEEPDICTAEDFEELCDTLTDSKQNGKLGEIFRAIYEKSTSLPDGVGIFDKAADVYKRDCEIAPEETFYGKEIMKLLTEALTHHITTLKCLLSEFGSDISSEIDTFNSDINFFEYIKSAETYAEARERLLNISYAPTARLKEKNEAILLARDERDKIKKSIEKITTLYFSYTPDEWKELYKNLYRVLSTLAKFLKKFDELYVREKIRRGMLEYSDIERFAYECLYTKDRSKTDIAQSYERTFSSVYIDEYQDVNEIQDAIFSAVSRKDNRFMVGDIKQSIYRFRSAKPEIFAKMKTTLPNLAESESGEGASVFMSRNYRCDRAIVDFVNAVFDSAFSVSRDAIGYVDGDKLQYSKIYGEGLEPEYTPAEIILFPKNKRTAPDTQEKSTDSADSTEASDDGTESEAEWVAKKISELLKNGRLASGEPIKPSDIAILLRKKSAIERFKDALSALGIPAETKDTKDFFMNAEVLLTLCLLNAIDNPSKDVYLAGLMCSPLYGFTPDDLVKIRKTGEGGRLFSDLKIYAERHPECDKTRVFLSELDKYRAISEGVSVDALIARLYRETGLIALASRNGGKENLMLLYNYARKFEGSSYEGLHSFISYINSVIAEKSEFDSGRDDTGEVEAVRIVTIHSSKGLEYPVVFLAGCGSKFTNLDKRQRFAYSEDFGLSVYLRAPTGLALVRNPVHHIIQDNMDKKYIEEELRVLYVALTRARERLFILGSAPTQDVDAYLSRMKFYRTILSPYLQKISSSFLDIILSSIPHSAAKIRVLGEDEAEICNTGIYSDEKNDSTPEKKNPVEKDIEGEMMRRFAYEYPYKEHTKIPEKLSVSRLYPTVLDGTEDITTNPIQEKTEKSETSRPTLPAFFTGQRDDEGARRGIATHTVLQFCDFEKLWTDGVDAELERLFTCGFISAEMLKLVRRDEIEAFRQSEILSEMRRAKKLYREFRFNSLLPAELFTREKREALSDTEILVQGVIDCIIECEDGKIILVDYKTDRLTKEELCNPTLAYESLYGKHSLQLEYYSEAVKCIFGRYPCARGVYSLPLGKFLEF